MRLNFHQDSPITVGNEELSGKLSGLKFASATYRLFKLQGMLEDEQEDFGQIAVYKGVCHLLRIALCRTSLHGPMHPSCVLTSWRIAAGSHVEKQGRLLC